MIISKEFVQAFLAEHPELQNFDKKYVDALFALYENQEETFARFSGTVSSSNIEQEDEEKFSAVVENFKSSLDGSKWKDLVTANKEEFVKQKYRMLSAGMVQEIFDFSHENGAALKAAQAAGKFDDLRFFKDHNFSVDAVVGVVGKSSWNEDGVPGVDNDVFVNKTLDPAFAKRFESGLVDSVSVGISFSKIKSHEFEDPWDFYSLLGREVDGSIVRFLVTEIHFVRELSSVTEGADPNAKAKFSKDSDNLKEFLETVNKAAEREIQELTSKVTELEARLAEFSAKNSDIEKLTASLQRYEELEKKFEGNLELLASKGLSQFTEEKRKLVSFLRITGRAPIASGLEATTDLHRIKDLCELFASDIQGTIPDVCPNCNNEVTFSKQASREPLAAQEVVVKPANVSNKNVDDFCEKIHK